MIIMLLRDLLFLLLLVVFVYGLYRLGKRLFIKEKVENAVDDIQTTIKTAKDIPDAAGLENAKRKINKTLKDGGSK